MGHFEKLKNNRLKKCPVCIYTSVMVKRLAKEHNTIVRPVVGYSTQSLC